MGTALLALYLAAGLAAGVVTALKGKWGVLAVGLVAGLAWFFGALRLAKPGSWWARRFYPEEKRERAAARHSSTRYRALVAAALTAAVVPALSLLLLGKAYLTPGSAMETTLKCAEPGIGCSGATSDRMFALRFGVGLEPRRSDIVAYRVDSHQAGTCGLFAESATFVHRIVALEGETITSGSGRVLIGGEPLDEPYLDPADPFALEFEATVPEGHVFLMGDNRGRSCDSVAFGPVPKERLVARIVFRYWPLERAGRL